VDAGLCQVGFWGIFTSTNQSLSSHNLAEAITNNLDRVVKDMAQAALLVVLAIQVVKAQTASWVDNLERLETTRAICTADKAATTAWGGPTVTEGPLMSRA
jgi:hypothetical protein